MYDSLKGVWQFESNTGFMTVWINFYIATGSIETAVQAAITDYTTSHQCRVHRQTVLKWQHTLVALAKQHTTPGKAATESSTLPTCRAMILIGQQSEMPELNSLSKSYSPSFPIPNKRSQSSLSVTFYSMVHAFSSL